MPKPFKETDYFNFKSISPSSLQQDNLISFSYHSPNGVHDKFPLVLVVEKQLDRIYGFNLHYDMQEMQELLENTNKKIVSFLEKEWYKKYPDKRIELAKQKKVFNKFLVEQKDLKDITRRIQPKDLEQYLVTKKNDIAFRCYLYKRMNKVSKLTWKI